MNVVVATAEPFGAYHLAPLVDSARDHGIDVVHLLPVGHPTQGSAFPTSSQLAALDDADRVVVTGGALAAWGEAVARAAIASGIVTVFSEMAYLETQQHPNPPAFTATTATSPAGAAAIAHHLGAGAPAAAVVGSPLLDQLPARQPVPGRVLVLSTVSAETPDGGTALRVVVDRLDAAGWDVVVRTHPRENRALWGGVTFDDSPTAAAAAAAAEVVVGHPGTAFVPAVAVGAPVVSIVTDPWMAGRVPDYLAALGIPVTDLDDVATAVAAAAPVDGAVARHATGPIGGSADRFWVAVTAAGT